MTKPPLTQAVSRKMTAKRIIKDVFGLETGNKIEKAFDFQRSAGVIDWVSMSDGDIQDYHYKEGGKLKYLPKCQQGLLRIFREWIYYMVRELGKTSIDWDDKTIINEDDFNEFRIVSYHPTKTFRDDVMNKVSTARTYNTNTNRTKAFSVDEFQKRIKRDKSHYAELKHEMQGDDLRKEAEHIFANHEDEKVKHSICKTTKKKNEESFNEHHRDKEQSIVNKFVGVEKFEGTVHTTKTVFDVSAPGNECCNEKGDNTQGGGGAAMGSGNKCENVEFNDYPTNGSKVGSNA